MDMLQLRKIFLQNYDVVSADYVISPSCKFSQAIILRSRKGGGGGPNS